MCLVTHSNMSKLTNSPLSIKFWSNITCRTLICKAKIVWWESPPFVPPKHMSTSLLFASHTALANRTDYSSSFTTNVHVTGNKPNSSTFVTQFAGNSFGKLTAIMALPGYRFLLYSFTLQVLFSAHATTHLQFLLLFYIQLNSKPLCYASALILSWLWHSYLNYLEPILADTHISRTRHLF